MRVGFIVSQGQGVASDKTAVSQEMVEEELRLYSTACVVAKRGINELEPWAPPGLEAAIHNAHTTS